VSSVEGIVSSGHRASGSRKGSRQTTCRLRHSTLRPSGGISPCPPVGCVDRQRRNGFRQCFDTARRDSGAGAAGTRRRRGAPTEPAGDSGSGPRTSQVATHRGHGRGGYGALYAITPDWHPILDRLPGVAGAARPPSPALRKRPSTGTPYPVARDRRRTVRLTTSGARADARDIHPSPAFPLVGWGEGPDGKRLASGAGGWDANGRPVSGDVRVWGSEAGKELSVPQGHTGHGYKVAFSPDGRRRVTAGSDRLLKVGDATEGRQLVSLKGHAGPVLGVALAPGGAGLATASADGTVRPWPLPPEARPPASLASDGNTATTKEAGEASRSPAGPQP
jgi:hypothetical protein